MQVYLVEDQTLLRETLSAMLKVEPKIEMVGGTEDAEWALQELETHDANVVLMDILPTGIDGIEAVRLLKEQHRDLAVVGFTSYSIEMLMPASTSRLLGNQ